MKVGIDRDALTVAMAVVPGFYSRNKAFSLYTDPEVRRARARAWAIRGAVRQLAGAQGPVTDVTFDRGHDGAWLRYRAPGVRLERRMELTRVEAACLAYLAGRAGVTVLAARDEDRAEVDAALRRLAIDLRIGEAEEPADDAGM